MSDISFEVSRWTQPPTFVGPGAVTEGTSASWATFSVGAAERKAGAPYHRYLLCRVWDPTRPLMGWLCCNPSDADAFVNDPSVRKMMGFARRGECGGILLGNTLSFASPHPSVLAKSAEPMGPRNVEMIAWLASNEDVVRLVAGWGGAIPKKLRTVAQRSIDAATNVRSVFCFGRTADGEPRHPLMLAYDTPLEGWR